MSLKRRARRAAADKASAAPLPAPPASPVPPSATKEQFLASVALMFLVLLVALYGFEPGHPCASVARLRFFLTAAACGVGLLVTCGFALWRLAGRQYPAFVATQVAFACIYVWIVAGRMVEWANTVFDGRPSVQATAEVVDYEISGGTVTRYSRTKPYFSGVRLKSQDATLDGAFVGRAAFPSRRDHPGIGAAMTLTLHRGWLRIPWVDQLDWTDR